MAERKLVTRHTDHAFDQADAIYGRNQHDDVAALGFRPAHEVVLSEWHAQAVGEFVDPYHVAFQNSGIHRSGGHGIVVDDGGAKGNPHETKEKKVGPPFAPLAGDKRGEVSENRESR